MLEYIVQQEPNNMPPVIRQKPDIRFFRQTMMYKEVKALSGYEANSKRPNERWCLPRGLMKRENGLPVCQHGTFSANQQRRIANFFVPNKKVDRLMSLGSKIYICRFNNDGSLLITVSQDGIVRIFDASKGTYHRIKRLALGDIRYSILDLDLSPCGQFFTYSTWEDAFHVVPLDGEGIDCQCYEVGENREHTGMFSVRFKPCDSGRTIVGGCSDSKIFICDRETRQISSIRSSFSPVVDLNALSFISDNDPNLLVSGCHGGLIKLWDLRCPTDSHSCTPSSVFLGHFDGITFINPRNDGKFILSNSKDQSIKIWDLRLPTPTHLVKKCQELPVIRWDYRVDQVPREYYSRTKVLDGDVSVMTYRGHRVSKSLLRAKFSPAVQTGQRYIYTGCSTGRIIIYDVLTGNIKEAIESHRNVIRDLDWHPFRSEIISGSFDAQVNLNMYRNNPYLKKVDLDIQTEQQPLRRSRRIAIRKGDYYEGDGEDDQIEF